MNSATKQVMIISRCSWTLFNFRLGLLKTLQNEGFRVSCAGSKGDGYEEYDDLMQSAGFPVNHIPINKKSMNPIKDLYLLMTLVVLFAKKKPDVVHLFTIKPVIYGALAARITFRPRIVATITGLGHAFIEGSSPLRAIVEFLYKVSLSSCDVVFFQNRDDLELFVRRGLVKETKTELVTGSGVDIDKFRPTDMVRHPSKKITFLMIGRLLREKGTYEFADAAAILQKKYANVRFELLGERDERNPSVVPIHVVENWITNEILIWHGSVVDVREYIEKADVVVLPSYREGTPRALLEAAAMGKPLVATNAVGCREVVKEGDNGFLVPVGDAQSLAAAMEKFIINPGLCTEMGLQAREFVVKTFNEKDVISDTLKQYV